LRLPGIAIHAGEEHVLHGDTISAVAVPV